MGLREDIRAARRRKAVRFAIEARDGRQAIVKAISESTDGGLLVHRAIEAGR